MLPVSLVRVEEERMKRWMGAIGCVVVLLGGLILSACDSEVEMLDDEELGEIMEDADEDDMEM